MQMVDLIPRAPQALAAVFQGLDHRIPGGRRARLRNARDSGAVLGEQRVDGSSDMLRFNFREARQGAEVKQGIVVGWHDASRLLRAATLACGAAAVIKPKALDRRTQPR